MSAALSLEPEEPDGSWVPGDDRAGGEGIPQGLYVTAPAEELSLRGSPPMAGRTPWRRARCWQ
jgi:hypothetical protein